MPQTVSAFNTSVEGNKTLGDYKKKCSRYDPSKNKGERWSNCKKLRESLVKDAKCNFGNNIASDKEIDDCQKKINDMPGSDIDQGLRSRFEEICTGLSGINPDNDTSKAQKLYRSECNKSYVQKEDQDKAAEKICEAFGGGKLKEQCKNYTNYDTDRNGGDSTDPALQCAANPGSGKCDLMAKYVNPFIGFLSALVGIAVTIGIISGGIRYAGAGDDPQKMNAAKQQITTAIIALVAYIFLYVLIKWLAPNT